jgi:Zn-dependent metalloprotease
MGLTVKRYQQYYKGIEVDNAEYLLHGKDGRIEAMNGDYQDIYYPKGELIIAKGNIGKNNIFRLSWKFIIVSLQPHNEQKVFVDAINGEIIRDIPLVWSFNTTGQAETLYSGIQKFTCDSYSGGYRLFESRNTTPGNTAIIHTKNCQNAWNTNGAIEFSNTSPTWAAGSWAAFSQSRAALDAHWRAEKVLDYWHTVHNRNSLDNAGLMIKNFVHYGIGWNNAGWWDNNKEITYGDGDGTTRNPFTALDMVAHEMGHGIFFSLQVLLLGILNQQR